MKDKLDNWENWAFTCDKCGWNGKGTDLEGGEMGRYGTSMLCPNCSNEIDFLESPLLSELLAVIDRFSPEEQASIRAQAAASDDWHRLKLQSSDQLPDIDADFIILLWDEDPKTQQIVIRFGDREIFRQEGSYEYFGFFVEACKILKTKYGRRLLDVHPTPRSYMNLWGDRISAPSMTDQMRKLIERDNSFTAAIWSDKVETIDAWKTYRAI